ncbi:MAG: porin family protein [Prevotella sp.]|nr:porin family protein [Prevotella sp.]
MFARGASTEIDAAYSNPAGLAWGHEGFQFSLNFQKPWQFRNIEAVTPVGSQKFEGKASAPIVPALFASYKKGNWAFSTMIGIVGSGGFVEYKEGVPMFNMLVSGMLGNMGIASGSYDINSEMKGKQYIYGGQFNITRKINDHFSAAIGLRANYYDGYYRGHVIANNHPQLGELSTLQLDVDQRGWGFAPIVSIDYHNGPLTIAARYEFRTKIETENKTNMLNAGLGTALATMVGQTNPAALQQIATTLDTYTTEYKDGVKTRYDMPSLLVAAVGYEFSPKLRGALEYHFFDDKHANMAGDRQKELKHGTHEILAGIEYDINDKLTVSCGGQRTDYGLSDDYQKDTSFACDSYSVGLGGAWNINDKLRLNVSYFCTLYSDYTKPTSYGSEIYSRTNNVIGVGIDYKF